MTAAIQTNLDMIFGTLRSRPVSDKLRGRNAVIIAREESMVEESPVEVIICVPSVAVNSEELMKLVSERE